MSNYTIDVNDPNEGNHLVVTPTPETMARLQAILSSPPMKLDDPSTWHVTLFVTPDKEVLKGVPRSDRVYAADAVKLVPVYSPKLGHSKLQLLLESRDMQRRYIDLRNTLGSTKTDFVYQPHLTLIHAMPGYTRASKAFVASIADTLSVKEAPFTFQGEIWLNSTDIHVTNPVLDSNQFIL